MKQIFLAALVVTTPLAATHTAPHYRCGVAPVEQTSEPASPSQKRMTAFKYFLGSAITGTFLGGLIEYMFRNQLNYGFKYGALCGSLVGARLAAGELWGKQDSWLWHDIIQLAVRLAERG